MEGEQAATRLPTEATQTAISTKASQPRVCLTGYIEDWLIVVFPFIEDETHRASGAPSNNSIAARVFVFQSICECVGVLLPKINLNAQLFSQVFNNIVG